MYRLMHKPDTRTYTKFMGTLSTIAIASALSFNIEKSKVEPVMANTTIKIRSSTKRTNISTKAHQYRPR